MAYRVIDGMTQEEVAELLGLARKTIMRMETRIEAKLDAMRTGKE
jgi:DNA-binding XRE family transcriptional regulator